MQYIFVNSYVSVKQNSYEGRQPMFDLKPSRHQLGINNITAHSLRMANTHV